MQSPDRFPQHLTLRIALHEGAIFANKRLMVAENDAPHHSRVVLS
jgi:hypothetical protein